MLRARRDAEVGKDQDENEDVIDAERVLDDVAGKKIEPGLVALRFPDEKIEGERENDPNKAALDRGSHAQLAIAPLETDQVDGQRNENAHVKGDPKPNIRGHGADRPMGRSPSQRQSAFFCSRRPACHAEARRRRVGDVIAATISLTFRTAKRLQKRRLQRALRARIQFPFANTTLLRNLSVPPWMPNWRNSWKPESSPPGRRTTFRNFAPARFASIKAGASAASPNGTSSSTRS